MFFPLLQTLQPAAESAPQSSIVTFFSDLGLEFSFGLMLGLIAVVFIVKGIMGFVSGWYRARILQDMTYYLKESLMRKIINVDYKYFVTKNSGYFLNVVEQQTFEIINSFTHFVIFFSSVLAVIAYVSIALYLDPIVSVLAVSAGLLIMVVLRNLNKLTKKESNRFSTELSSLNKLTIQIFKNYKYLRSTSTYEKPIAHYNASAKKLAHVRYLTVIYNAIFNALSEPIAVILLIIILYVQVVVLKLPVEVLLVILVIFYRVLTYLLGLQGKWQAVLKHSGGVQLVTEEKSLLDQHKVLQRGSKIERFSEMISFRNIDVVLGNTKVLESINLDIKKNSSVAFVGASGAGKTTLINVLSGLISPSGGSISVDGVPLEDADLQSWQSQLGVVTQEPYLFDDSIYENVALSADTIDASVQDRVVAACKEAHCHDFILDLENDYNTTIGDAGARASGGQKQRIAIAREIFKNPTVMILDEATSALDSESEKIIQESIDKYKGKMTLILIAHRLSTIKEADVIYEMDSGRIINHGTFDELLADSPSFRNLVSLQNLQVH